ncbi:hypothetical protein HDV05_005143 [Chytridiales sp. JEL 0842]|nr:hypothetical protein HDV05_005143 [Chytridiales sp. JEL 0842]
MRLKITTALVGLTAALASFAPATAQAQDIAQFTVNGSLWLPGFLRPEDARNPTADGTDGYAILKTANFTFLSTTSDFRAPTLITFQLICNRPGQQLKLARGFVGVSSKDRNYVIPSNGTQVFYITTDAWEWNEPLQIQRTNGYRNDASCDLFVQLNQPVLDPSGAVTVASTRPYMFGRDIPPSSYGGKLIGFNEATTPAGFVTTRQISTPVFKTLNSVFKYSANCYRPQLIAPVSTSNRLNRMPKNSAVKITFEYDAPDTITDGPFTIFYKSRTSYYGSYSDIETDDLNGNETKFLSFSPIRTTTTADGRQRSTYDAYLNIEDYLWTSGAICIRPNQIKGDEYKVSFQGLDGKDVFAGTGVSRVPGSVTTFSTGDISAETGPKTFTIRTNKLSRGLALFVYSECLCATAGKKAPNALPSLAWTNSAQLLDDFMYIDSESSPVILANGDAVYVPRGNWRPKQLDSTGTARLTIVPGADSCKCQVTVKDNLDTTKDLLYPTKEKPTECAFAFSSSTLYPGVSLQQTGKVWKGSPVALRFIYPPTNEVQQVSLNVNVTFLPNARNLGSFTKTVFFNEELLSRRCKFGFNADIQKDVYECNQVFTFRSSITTAGTSNCVSLNVGVVKYDEPLSYIMTLTEV